MIIETNSPLPQHPRPVIVIGAGGIVNDAHLPAYQIAGFRVAGIYDIDREKALRTAAKFDIPLVYDNPEDMLDRSPFPVVFDVAVPGSQLLEVLQRLPEGASVLLQKPMGDDLSMARAILDLTRARHMTAGVNFQLRYAPFINAARQMIKTGLLGELHDIEINVNVYTPWRLWTFLYSLPRVEILYHSIHYIDVVRTFFGNPDTIYAKTVKHPGMPELASVRTNIIMDYGSMIRANILTNHCHDFGQAQQQSYIKFEGTRGAIRIKMGLLMNYPQGVPDRFDYILIGPPGSDGPAGSGGGGAKGAGKPLGEDASGPGKPLGGDASGPGKPLGEDDIEPGKPREWKTLDIHGGWFPHAFIGSMAQVMLAAEGSIERPDNSVEDAIHTMACVEAAYASSARGGVQPDY